MRQGLTALFRELSKSLGKGLSTKPVGENSKGQTTKYFDVFAEKKIISFLIEKFPFACRIISEEKQHPLYSNTESKKNYTIIIDPVDGSDNYMNGVPFVCMGIAVFDPEGKPYMSFCGNYYSGEYFYADRKNFYSSFRINKKACNSLLYTLSGIKAKQAEKLPGLIKSYSTVRSFGATIGELMLVMKGAYSAFADVREKLTLENFAPFFLAEKHGKIVLSGKNGMKIKFNDYSLSAGYSLLAASGRKNLKKLMGLI